MICKVGKAMVTITDKEFNKLAAYIKAHYGIFLKKEKKQLVIGRLHSVLQEYGFSNFSEYYEYLVSDKSGAAVDELINRITTNHTYFMRERSHFYFFRDEVLPFLEEHVKARDLRVWCAGCSSGEEAYTLAMIIDEFFAKKKMNWDTKILATDISDKVLKSARQGIYKKEIITHLPPLWVMKYFTKESPELYAIDEKIKKEVIYRRFNLMERFFPFRKKFHVIFCRNVMIYFDQKTKVELTKKFYDILEYGGYLFIGHSESLFGSQTGFKYIRPAVYRK